MQNSFNIVTASSVRRGSARPPVNPWTMITLIIFLGLNSCVQHRPYWVEKTTDGLPWSRSSQTFVPKVTQVEPQYLVDPNQKPRLAVVEYDDHGDPWTHKQPAAALKMVNDAKSPLLVVYIHGWKHNASAEDNDFKTFQKLLSSLAAKPPLKGRFEVCGIYIGWRGDLLQASVKYAGLDLVRQATIYNRMDAADRIANALPLAQLLSQVSAKASEKGGKTVMIGHSLGARILETTLTRSLVGNVSNSQGKDASLVKPANLILLINPASDAVRARQAMIAVQWAMKSRQKVASPHPDAGKSYHVPLVVSMRSETDGATGRIYPFAMQIGRWNRQTRMYPVASGLVDHPQRSYITHPAPTLDHLRSHEMGPADAPGGFVEDPFRYNLNNATKNKFVLGEGVQQKWWQIREDEEGAFKLYDPGHPQRRRGAYWIMEVPESVLHDHSGNPAQNGIFSPIMIQFIAALYSICEPQDVLAQPASTLSSSPSATTPTGAP